MGDQYIIPAPPGSTWTPAPEDVTLELARSRQVQGKLFRKHILTKGTLYHPKTGERIDVDDTFIDTMLRNFQDGVGDIVQVPLANDANEHVENPDKNLGEVVGLQEEGGKVYALIDARENAHKFGKTYLGASAFLSTNYTDTRTNTKAGPTLLHVAVTNRPYVTGLEDYKEVIAATRTDDSTGEPIVLTTEETVPKLTKDELIAQLRDEHGIDVESLQATAGQNTDQLTAALTAVLTQTPVGLSRQSADSITQDDLVGAVVELSQQNKTIAAGYDALRQERAADVVDGLIGEGRILPKQREFAIRLRLANVQEFNEFVPAEPIVAVGEQAGFTAPRDEREREDQEAEVLRLTNDYKQYFEPPAAIGSNGHGRR